MPVADSVRVPIESDADVVMVRQEARTMGGELGFSSLDLTLLATAISEVARNITTYAGRGEVVVRVLRDRGREGIEVVASDEGPGITNVELALQDGYTTGNGGGRGLPGGRRRVGGGVLATQPGAGTRVRLVKWRA
jgi:serine/threonine-protein kinase RsbT